MGKYFSRIFGKKPEPTKEVPISIPKHPKFLTIHEHCQLPDSQKNTTGIYALDCFLNSKPVYKKQNLFLFWSKDFAEWRLRSHFGFDDLARAVCPLEFENPKLCNPWKVYDYDNDTWSHIVLRITSPKDVFPKKVHLKALVSLEYNANVAGTYEQVTDFKYNHRPVYRKRNYVLFWHEESETWRISNRIESSTSCHAFSKSLVVNPEDTTEWQLYTGKDKKFDNGLIEVVRGTELKSDTICVACQERKCNICLVPCGHVVYCNTCAIKAKHMPCPVCRAEIDIFQKMYGL